MLIFVEFHFEKFGKFEKTFKIKIYFVLMFLNAVKMPKTISFRRKNPIVTIDILNRQAAASSFDTF
jgi:hypothetical protein